MTPLVRWGRAYFALQALAGAAWWMAVCTSPVVRAATLGRLDPLTVALFDVPLFVAGSVLAALGMRWAALVVTVWTALVAAALTVYATVTAEAGWGVLVMAAAAAGCFVAACAVVWGRLPTEWVVRGPFAFHAAGAGRGPAGNVARTFAQIVVFWGVALLVVPLVIAALQNRWGVGLALPPSVSAPLAVAGGALLLLASALGIWSAVVMSTLGDGTPLPSAMANRLVISGPYRWVRNPMAVAGITQGVAVGLLLSSWLVVVYALAGSLVWNYAIRPHEEADLEHRFGADFARYRAEVRCWVPRLAPVGHRVGTGG